MTWLVAIGLTNTVLAGGLACIAWGVGRCCRRPALTRLLWIVVLCKLLAPPLARAPMGDWLAVPRQWLPEAVSVSVATIEHGTIDSVSGGPARSSLDASPLEAPPASPAPTIAVANNDRKLSNGGAESRRVPGRNYIQALLAISPQACLRWAALLWIGGSVGCLFWLAHRAWRFRRFLAQAARYDADLSRRAAQLGVGVGLGSAPQVLIVESAVSPMLWGAGRSAHLLFPAELTRRIDDEACDALLLHELAHYARRDWLVRVLELAVQVVYWWNPLVWWARREIEAAEEECCDAWVISHQAGSPRIYAEALLATLDFLCEPIRPLPPAACGLGVAPLLRSRLTQIMCGDVALHPSPAAKMLVLATAAVVLPLGPSFVGQTQPEAAARSSPPFAIAPAIADEEVIDDLDSAMVASAKVAVEATRSDPKSGSWYIPRDPLPPRVSAVLYATAVSPNGKHKLEARTGHRVTLSDIDLPSRLDLSSHRIRAASFSPDSRRFVTAQDDDNRVRLWDSNTGELLKRLLGSEAAVKSVAFAPDGRRVAAGAEDGSVLIWDVGAAGETDAPPQELARFPRGDAPVSCLRWSRQGDRLAISLGDWSNPDSSSLVIWQPAAGIVGKELPLDQSTAAVDWLSDDELIVANWDGDAKVIDLTTVTNVESQTIPRETIWAAVFSPDCTLLPRWQAGRLARGGD